MKQIRVLLIEDHFLARVALQSVLAGYAEIEVIGEAGMEKRASLCIDNYIRIS
jgi:DNA-binding NarL/FixJ family response regulator